MIQTDGYTRYISTLIKDISIPALPYNRQTYLEYLLLSCSVLIPVIMTYRFNSEDKTSHGTYFHVLNIVNFLFE